MNSSLSIVFYILLFLVVLESLLTFIISRTKSILKPSDTFPIIEQKLINKFNSFDPVLGWCNKPNTKKMDHVNGNVVTYSFGNYGERKTIGADENIIFSSYGDSFCQCREVNDNETWQAYFYKNTNRAMLNFGVGNYGVDQSFLRLKRDYHLNPTKYVVLEMVPHTITRITSVWKHFSEPGNILNFKPRFNLNGSLLELVENILTDKNKLLNISLLKEEILKKDEHYPYFKKFVFKRPYVISLLFNPTTFIEKAFFPRLAKFFYKIKVFNIERVFRQLSKKHVNKYRESLYETHALLLASIIDEFYKFSQEKKFVPILLILPEMEEVLYTYQKKDKYYSKLIESLNKDIYILDFMDEIIGCENLREYYVYGWRGGHMSPYGNLKVSEYLERKFKEIGYL